MSLTTEQIVSNTKKYFDTLNKIGINTTQLLPILGDDFIKASAFPTSDMPNCFEGGLIDFALTVTKKLMELNDKLPENKKTDKNSLIKVGLLHLIGKCNLYHPNPSDWHVKRGILYECNNKLTSMRVGQRSLYICMSTGIMFTEDEAQALLFHDFDDDKMKFYISNTAKLLKLAIELAIIEKK